MFFSKKALSIDEQINLLEDRGLIIEDKVKAAHYLSNISYYRLSAYWYIFLRNPKKDHKFYDNASFQAAVDTYVFDRKLRVLIFDEIERIEIALRTQIIYHFSLTFGNNWYENMSLFIDETYYKKFHAILNKAMNDTNEVFIKHYKNTYDQPINPPCWMTFELLSLGQLSMLFKNLKNCNAKKAVANHFSLHETLLESWLESISFVRNTCAHHSRLWNRKLPKPPKLPKKTARQWISILPEDPQRNRVFLVLSIINYLLKDIVPDSTFRERLIILLNRFPAIPINYMGFPINWRNDPFWQIV